MQRRSVKWTAVLVLLVALLAPGLAASAAPAEKGGLGMFLVEGLLGMVERFWVFSTSDPAEEEEPPKVSVPEDGGAESVEEEPGSDPQLGPELDPVG